MKNNLNLPSIFPVTCHTDHVGPNSTFVAIQGYRENGTNYISTALQKGATTIVVQTGTVLSEEVKNLISQKKAQLTFVEDTRKALADLTAQALDYPAHTLKIIGITGTKGKTTTTFLVDHILKEAGYKTAHISSIDNTIVGKSEDSTLTSPPADYIQLFLHQCVKEKIDYVIMEVAAHALELHRTRGLEFDGVIFTNFEKEHLEFFNDIDDYFSTKLRIFKQIKSDAPALINSDNQWCKKIKDTHPFVKEFGLDNKKYDYTALVDGGWEHRISFTYPEKNHNYRLICPHLIGQFNAYNVLASIALTRELGVSIETIAAALYSFTGLPGRQEKYELPNKATCYIDFAHTPKSYDALLSTLRLLTDNLIVVFGHGGERDPKKRPLLGAVASQYADHIILTSDNPRSENPKSIIEDIASGIPKNKQNIITTELNRAQAIKKAYNLSDQNSIIAILGKGQEECQIIGNKKIHYSDKEVIKSL